MKRILTSLLLALSVLSLNAQEEAVRLFTENPDRAANNMHSYEFNPIVDTKAPKGFKPFYISHYGRHGSRYEQNSTFSRAAIRGFAHLDSLDLLTETGKALYADVKAITDAHVGMEGSLTPRGAKEHQTLAKRMSDRFPDVFKKGGDVFAISSLSGRCVLSMASFCQELTQCNPKIEIRMQSARKVLDGVKPDDRQNPLRQQYPKSRPRFEQNRQQFKYNDDLRERIIPRVFTSTEGLPGTPHHIASNLINLYTSLPSIGHEGMMGNIITDQELAARWENENLGGYTWVFEPRYDMIPILRDIIRKADNVLSGQTKRLADLRFGHDTCLGPLTVLMGINGADIDPEDPYEVKNCYQTWETCKASNLQLIFYRSKKAGDPILIKCLLNGIESTLPLPSDLFPYYRWDDFKTFYTERCNSVPTE